MFIQVLNKFYIKGIFTELHFESPWLNAQKGFHIVNLNIWLLVINMQT